MDIQAQLKRYRKDFTHSYTFGVFPTLELMIHQPDQALGVLIHPKGVDNSGITKIKSLCKESQVPFKVDKKAIHRIGARENDFAVGIFRKMATNLDGNSDHLVLVNPSGKGNLGTIQRTMLGFGFVDLAIIQPAADIFHPDTVRASMGSLFQHRIELFRNLNDYQEKYPRDYFPFMTDGEERLGKVTFTTPFSLVFGSEGAGLPKAFHFIGTSVRIDQSDKIDSLNIAIAVGISLYEARK